MTIAVAADHAGVGLKDAIVSQLKAAGLTVRDFGTDAEASVDYPDFAHKVADFVVQDTEHRGILVCGTGVGMSMAANRHRGTRAVVSSDLYTVRMAREHNDANVLCLGARVVGSGLGEELVRVFLATKYAGGRHARRVAKIEV